MLSFWCQKNSLSLSIPLLLEVLCMKQPDDRFLKFFLLNMWAPRIMAFLVPAHFMFIQEILIEGFVLKKNFSSYSFVEAAVTIGKLFLDIFYKFLVVSRVKFTTNLYSPLLQIDHFFQKLFEVSLKNPFQKNFNF